MSDITSFCDACRENTGSHFLDSGGAYGRHWEAPPIPENAPIVTWDEHGATIHTGPFLDETMEIDQEWQNEFEEWSALPENERLSWFEAAECFMDEKRPDWTRCARDNVYNSENDFSQVFVFEVWAAPDAHTDDWVWLRDDESIVIIHVHTGCDVRGGYGRPLFCHGTVDEYVMPLDWTAEFWPVEARDADGDDLEPHEVTDVDRWCCGYSSWPAGQLEDSVARVFEWTRDVQAATVVVLTKAGERVKVAASARTF